MAVEPRSSWPAEIEAAICSLKDVDAASVQVEGPDIREIHIVSSSERSAKLLVRDVQSLLRARFARDIDHRVVSVAFIRSGTGAIPVREAAAPSPAPPPVAAIPGVTLEAPPTPRSQPARESRIRFGSVNLYVSGPRAQAQVELRWKGLTRSGTAGGSATREGGNWIVAEATVRAIEEYLEDDLSLSVLGVEITRIGRREAAVVALTLLAHRQEKTLVGTCTVEQDVAQAVALATLSALNRVVGGLETREPTEYVLRPTSTQEASEAT